MRKAREPPARPTECQQGLAERGSRLPQSAFQVAALGGVPHELDRPAVGKCGLVHPAEPPQQVGPRRVHQVVRLELAVAPNGLDHRQPSRRTVRHRNGDRPVELHDR